MADFTKAINLYEGLIAETLRNKDFKQSLINDPKTTIENFDKNVKVPIDLIIIVEDQSNENCIYLNIPKKVELDDLELSAEELELVAGGATPGLAAVTICTTLGCVVGGVILLGAGIAFGALT